ncbi:hypothetical protein [Azorhizobium doebereinerae]|uniref:hypothetical protein n=1 Tax=Azorhizobium doebereinerae TaxID=281091 RepID=UPI0004081DFC|nr:hypothetical protein [Azorhizobium doebereinerae]
MAGMTKAAPTGRLRPILLAGALLAIWGADASQAATWSRSGSVTTARGTSSGSVSGACAAGTCTRAATVSGPYGGTASRSGSITRTGPHAYSYARTTTGPYGGSVSRSGWVGWY